jgi:hypothetical protein
LVVGVALIHGPFVDEVLAYIARDGRFRSCSTNDDEGLDMKLDMKFDLAVVQDAHSLAVDRTVNAPPVTIVMSPVGAPLDRHGTGSDFSDWNGESTWLWSMTTSAYTALWRKADVNYATDDFYWFSLDERWRVNPVVTDCSMGSSKAWHGAG